MTTDNLFQNILMAIIRRMPDSTGKQNTALNYVWQKVVGSIIGSHSFVDHLDANGKLVIILTKKDWITPLKASEKMILQKIMSQSSQILQRPVMIRSLSFRIDTTETPCESVTKQDNISIRPEQDDLILEAAEEIPDVKLRESFLRVYHSYPFSYGEVDTEN